MKNKCLYCYKETDGRDFHEKCSRAFFGTSQPPLLEYAYNEMAEMAKSIVERSIAIPGVQPKLSLSLVKEVQSNGNRARLTVVGALDGNYVLKPPTGAYPELPANEHVTMRIAEALRIPVVTSTLIRLSSGELSYITRRIDRSNDGTKIHMLDMYQILEAFDKYKGSMERVAKALNDYSARPLLDKLRFFELALFCYLSGNNDMHLKNFSMIKNGDDWYLAPAYDLLNVSIANPDDPEELALTLKGKKRKIQRIHFETFGLELGLTEKQLTNVFKRFEQDKKTALAWIRSSFLSPEMQEAYITLLTERYQNFGLS